MDDDRGSRTLVERAVDSANEKVNRLQSGVDPVVSATKDHANGLRTKAQEAAQMLPFATRDDLNKLQEQLDRIEAAVADLTSKQEKPAATRRVAKPKPVATEPAAEVPSAEA